MQQVIPPQSGYSASGAQLPGSASPYGPQTPDTVSPAASPLPQLQQNQMTHSPVIQPLRSPYQRPGSSPHRSVFNSPHHSPTMAPVDQALGHPQMISAAGMPNNVGTQVQQGGAYLMRPKMSVSKQGGLTSSTLNGDLASRSERAYSHSPISPSMEKTPLLPINRHKSEEKERQTARNLFIWLGVSTLTLQTMIFNTMEDVQNRFFPTMRYAFYCHNIFAITFFVGTAAFACFPSRLLFSIRLLTVLNFLAIGFATAFPALVILGAGTEPAFIATLCLVGCITFMSVLLIPVIFTSASAVPGDCAMYAAVGQGIGAVGTAALAAVFVYFLPPRPFLAVAGLFSLAIHAIAILTLQRLESYKWAARRLQRLSDAHNVKATDGYRRPSRAKSHFQWTAVIRRVWAQLCCAFFSTFISFALFPAFSTMLGHETSRGFGVCMISIFHASDQLGRHVPETGIALPPLAMLVLVIVRFGFLPLYVAMYSAAAGRILSTSAFKALMQFLLGLTHGWSVASSFRYIPVGLSKYEVERTQFYLSLSNALGIPCGALLMSALVSVGWFPSF